MQLGLGAVGADEQGAAHAGIGAGQRVGARAPAGQAQVGVEDDGSLASERQLPRAHRHCALVGRHQRVGGDEQRRRVLRPPPRRVPRALGVGCPPISPCRWYSGSASASTVTKASGVWIPGWSSNQRHVDARLPQAPEQPPAPVIVAGPAGQGDLGAGPGRDQRHVGRRAPEMRGEAVDLGQRGGRDARRPCRRAASPRHRIRAGFTLTRQTLSSPGGPGPMQVDEHTIEVAGAPVFYRRADAGGAASRVPAQRSHQLRRLARCAAAKRGRGA